MPKITVDLKEKTYTIDIARGLLKRLGTTVRKLSLAQRVAIITDATVGELYGQVARESLEEAGFQVVVITIAPGEEHKNLATLGAVYEELSQAALTRQDLVITLGGGVVGDLGGFAAASYLRGIDFIQVPTTVLAQIDSSVGGKVAVDLPSGKNLVGSFHQPLGVLIDPNLLSSLSVRFLHDGLAEVIKTAAFGDASFFAFLEGCADDAAILANIEHIIATCCAIKAKVVSEDELDQGARMMLNFGHTIGHGVEQSLGYGYYTHGEGVAIGMVSITKVTEAAGKTKAGTAQRLEALLQRFNLPTTVELHQEQLLEAMTRDKKKRGDNITVVILTELGQGKLEKIPFSALPKYIG